MSELKEYLYILRATRLEMLTEEPFAEEEAAIAGHVAYLRDLLEKGTAILFGRTENNDERTIGIVIFKAPSYEEARRIMENDPAVESGIMRGELFPYRIAGIRGGAT